MYRQILDPVAHSLGWSSLAAVVPLAALFVMLGALRLRAWVASVVSLAVAIAVAVALYGMPIDQAALAGSEGGRLGLLSRPSSTRGPLRNSFGEWPSSACKVDPARCAARHR
jgi:hypothetical protein